MRKDDETEAQYEVRRLQLLKALACKKRWSTQTAFAEAVDVQQDYVSRVKAGRKRLTGDMARIWERRAGLTPGYFDNQDIAPTDTAPASSEVSIEDELRSLRNEFNARIDAVVDRIRERDDASGDTGQWRIGTNRRPRDSRTARKKTPG